MKTANTSVNREMIGVHWDVNERDETTDCWYQDYDGSGQYSSGHGVDVLIPEAQKEKTWKCTESNSATEQKEAKTAI